MTRHHVREWASKNAYTLIFLSTMFFVTWIVVFVANVLT